MQSKSFQCVLFLLLLVGCTQKPYRPSASMDFSLRESSQVQKANYPETSEGIREYKIDLAQSFYHEANRNLLDALETIHALHLSASPSGEPERKMSLVTEWVDRFWFRTRVLSEEEISKVDAVWKKLLQVDDDLLYCAALVAELRQKSRQTQEKRIEEKIASLPTLEKIEWKRREGEILRNACQQMAACNESLFPPLWEKMKEEDLGSQEKSNERE